MGRHLRFDKLYSFNWASALIRRQKWEVTYNCGNLSISETYQNDLDRQLAEDAGLTYEPLEGDFRFREIQSKYHRHIWATMTQGRETKGPIANWLK